VSFTLSNALRSSMANAVTAAIDAGSGPGLLRVYAGTRPAGPDTAVTSQTLLLEVELADPSFGAAANGVITLDASPALAAEGLADGTATWFRIVDSNDAAILDGKASAAGGGGNLILSTTTVSVGLDVEVVSGTITMPAGTAD